MADVDNEAMRAGALRIMFSGSPFITALGMELVSVDEGGDGVTVRMPFSGTVDNGGGTPHGGAIASLVDTAGAAAVWAGHDFANGSKASTVSLTVNFVGAGRDRDLVATARVVRRAKELAFAEISVATDEGRAVASGVLVYRIVP